MHNVPGGGGGQGKLLARVLGLRHGQSQLKQEY